MKKRAPRPHHCARCGKLLQPSEWAIMLDSTGYSVIVCKDDRSCWPPKVQHSHRLAMLHKNQEKWGWMT